MSDPRDNSVRKLRNRTYSTEERTTNRQTNRILGTGRAIDRTPRRSSIPEISAETINSTSPDSPGPEQNETGEPNDNNPTDPIQNTTRILIGRDPQGNSTLGSTSLSSNQSNHSVHSVQSSQSSSSHSDLIEVAEQRANNSFHTSPQTQISARTPNSAERVFSERNDSAYTLTIHYKNKNKIFHTKTPKNQIYSQSLTLTHSYFTNTHFFSNSLETTFFFTRTRKTRINHTAYTQILLNTQFFLFKFTRNQVFSHTHTHAKHE